MAAQHPEVARYGQHGGDTPLHLCPWCKAHVAEHDGVNLAKHGEKWRIRYVEGGDSVARTPRGA